MKEKRKYLTLIPLCLFMIFGIYTVQYAGTSTKMHIYFIDKDGNVLERGVMDPLAVVKTTSGSMNAITYNSQKLTINNLQADTLRLYTEKIQLQGKSNVTNLIVNEPVQEVSAATGTEFNYTNISGDEKDSFINSLPKDLTVGNGSISKGKVTLDKTTASIYEKGIGNTVTLKATVDGTGTVKWASSNPKVATVKDGIVTGVGKGSTKITATLYNNDTKVMETSCNITVKEATLTLDKTSANIYAKGIGNTTTINATVNGTKVTGNAVVWKSSNTSIAKVDKNGIVTGVKEGTIIISATVNGISKNVSVTVKEPTLSLSKTSATIYTKGTKDDKTITLTAKVNGTAVSGSNVTWSTSDKSVATVTNGKVEAVSKGKVTITAKANGVSKTCTITVKNPSITVKPVKEPIKKGKTKALEVTVYPKSGTPTYTSSKKSIATVSKDGIVTGVSAGDATITVKCNGASATVKVTVE